MINCENYEYVIIFFGAVFSFILAIGQSVIKNRNFNNFLLALLLLSFGFFQITNCFLLFRGSNLWYEMYHIAYPAGIIVFFFMGPLQYAYFHSLVEPEARIPKSFILHFFPGFFFLMVFLVSPHPDQNTSIPPVKYCSYLTTNDTIYRSAAILSVVSFFIYMSFFFIKLFLLHSRKYTEKKKSIRRTMCVIVLLLLLVVYWFIDTFFSLNNRKDIHAILSIYVIGIYILSNRYPSILHVIKSEIERAKYLKTQLQGVNVNSIIEKLTSLMIKDKIFTDENLSLPSLSERLNIRQHQLSEILNSYLKTSFFHFVNEYRIREAQKLLMEKPELSIIEITYEIGYSSSSVFYEAFKKNTGFSPAEYKRNNQKKYRPS